MMVKKVTFQVERTTWDSEDTCMVSPRCGYELCCQMAGLRE